MTTSRRLSGGRKKRGNGHKMNCGCPICKNMRKSKKRGGADYMEDDMMEDNNMMAADNNMMAADDNMMGAEVADDMMEAEAEDEDLFNIDGGRRRRKHKKSSRRTRRHKKSRKSRKSRRHRRH